MLIDPLGYQCCRTPEAKIVLQTMSIQAREHLVFRETVDSLALLPLLPPLLLLPFFLAAMLIITVVAIRFIVTNIALLYPPNVNIFFIIPHLLTPNFQDRAATTYHAS